MPTNQESMLCFCSLYKLIKHSFIYLGRIIAVHSSDAQLWYGTVDEAPCRTVAQHYATVR